MPQHKQTQSVMFFAQSGCLLPLLIILNLLFGWMFLKPGAWLIVGAILIGLFWINSLVLAKKISSAVSPHHRRGAIDIEAEVVDDGKLKAKNKKHLT